MENNFFETIKNRIKEKSLTDDERGTIRNRLLTYAHTHPVPSNFGWMPSFWSIPRGAFVVVMLLVVTSVTYAAEPALPGDLLYPIKVDVTERVKGVFITSPIARASYEVSLVDKRLTEAETLAVQGKLDQKVVKVIEDKIEEHTDTVNAHVQELKKEDKTEAATVAGQLANSFNKHEVAISVIEDVNAAAQVAIVSNPDVLPDGKGVTNVNPDARTTATLPVVSIDLKAKIQEKAEIANRDKSNLDNEILFDTATGITVGQEKNIDDESTKGTDIFDGDAEMNMDLEDMTDPGISVPPDPTTSTEATTTINGTNSTIVPISPTPGSPYKFFGR